jgi:hypothetical protein
MAVSNLSLTQVGSNLFDDTANTNGAIVVKNTSGTLYVVDIDNTALAAIIYVKLYDLATTVTVGTTVPDWVFKVAASVRKSYVIPGGAALANGLQVATVTTGGTAGTTAVATPPTVRIVYS